MDLVTRVRSAVHGALRALRHSDAGITAVEYGVMFAVFGAGMIGAVAFLITGTTNNYQAAEASVAAAPIVCTGDEFFDVASGLCVPKVVCNTGEWANPATNVCEAVVECAPGSYADPATNTCIATGLPGAPTNLTGVAASGTSVTLTWAPPDTTGGPITDYVVEWSTNSGASWPGGNNQVVAGTTATVTGLSVTLPQFRVYARNATGSGPATAVVVVSLNKPSAPTITGVTASYVNPTHTLSVAFTAPTFASSATTYEYSTDGGSSWKVRSNTPSTASPLAITTISSGATPLVGDTYYVIAIRAVNTNGAGSTSNIVQARTVGPAGPPEIIDITPSSAQLSVAFTAPVWQGSSAITTYQYSTDNGTTWKVRATGTTASPIVITTISGAATALLNGTAYSVRIRAINSDPQPGTPSAAVSATPGSVPLAPTLGAITKTAANVNPPVLTVPFTAGGNGGSAITLYQYSTDAGATWKTRSDGGTTASPVVISVTSDGVSTLGFATTYQVQLRAVNAVGNGIASASSSVTTNNGPPNAPTITAVTSSTSGTVTLTATFTAPASNGGSAITSYEYTTNNGTNFAAKSTSGSSPNLTMAITTTTPGSGNNLVNGTSYTIKIRAVSATGAGAWSNAVTVTAGAKANAPTITAITPGNQQLSVAFTAPTGVNPAITTYQYSTDDGLTWRTRATGTTASPLVITRTSGTYALLTNGTTYKVRIRAVNAVGPGTESAPAVLGIPCGPPGAPKSVTGSVQNAPSPVGINVTYAPNAFTGGCAVTAYRIKWSSDGGNTWSAWLNDPTAGSPVLVLKTDGLAASTTYIFRMQAQSLGGWSPDSLASASVTTPNPPTAPAAPTAAITASPAGIRVTWSPPGGSIVTDYVIQRSANGGAFGTPVNDSASPLDIAAAGLSAGTPYTFRVAGSNGWESSLLFSPASASVTTPSAPAQPGAPTVTPSTTLQELTVSWSALVPAPVGGYLVQEVTSGGANVGAAVAVLSGTSLLDNSGLAANTRYYFKVAGVNAWGAAGPYSAVGSGLTPSAPGAPTGVGGTRGNGQVALTWTAPASNGGSGITDYVVQYGTSASGPWTTFADGTSSTAAATVTGLTNGTNYYFQVAAVTPWATGSYSAVFGPSKPATVPGAPSTPTRSARNTTSITIAWNAPGSTGGEPITSYVVEYKLNSGSTWNNWATGSPFAGRSAVITGLTSATSYNFRVRAVNLVGQSANSGTLTTSTQ